MITTAYKCFTHDLRPPISGPPEKYTTGIRDAYASGLELAIPTGPDELGWVMA